MRKQFVVGAAALAVFCTAASAQAVSNSPKAPKAFGQVRLTIKPLKNAVAHHSVEFRLSLHNPTGKAFQNVQLALEGMLNQFGNDLVRTPEMPSAAGPPIRFRARKRDSLYYWNVAKLRPGTTKVFVLVFEVGSEKGATKKACLRIGASLASAINGKTTHHAKGCTPYLRR